MVVSKLAVESAETATARRSTRARAFVDICRARRRLFDEAHSRRVALIDDMKRNNIWKNTTWVLSLEQIEFVKRPTLLILRKYLTDLSDLSQLPIDEFQFMLTILMPLDTIDSSCTF